MMWVSIACSFSVVLNPLCLNSLLICHRRNRPQLKTHKTMSRPYLAPANKNDVSSDGLSGLNHLDKIVPSMAENTKNSPYGHARQIHGVFALFKKPKVNPHAVVPNLLCSPKIGRTLARNTGKTRASAATRHRQVSARCRSTSTSNS